MSARSRSSRDELEVVGVPEVVAVVEGGTATGAGALPE
jgi:hypothetical protein